jgi:long-chain acyl-CoA synthetase
VALFTPSEKALRQFGGAPSTTTGGGGALDVTALRAALETEVAAVNAGLAPYETIKAFAVLPEDFTEAAGEMTPSMKVKRKAVAEKYRDAIEGLYK